MHDAGAARGAAMLRTAMGPEVSGALGNPHILEVTVNPDGRLWLDHAIQGRVDTGICLGPAAVERIVRLVASQAGRASGPGHPIVSAELPATGERFEGVLPPVTRDACFSIRRPAGRVIVLDAYVENGALSPAQAALLREAVRSRRNIVVAGGASSGKTTLANALLHEMRDLGHRVVLLEDTRELVCDTADCVALRTQPGHVTLSDLLRSTLRLRPDRIVVGEVRGPEALALVKAWNTGHPGGLATLHANSAAAALARLEQLIQEAAAAVDRRLVTEAVDLVVFVARQGTRRRVESLLAVHGLAADGSYAFRDLGADPDHPGRPT
ncbi:MAG: P-type conjugative transfer ATPase TrbB [Chloroflexi bacterium]|nr:P-type conjugative transfer ATPase TrbB [Chloroflexota bacterium]